MTVIHYFCFIDNDLSPVIINYYIQQIRIEEMPGVYSIILNEKKAKYLRPELLYIFTLVVFYYSLLDLVAPVFSFINFIVFI